MTKMKTTKSALVLSIVSLFLCFTMLIGTTFAWFTDSVTSANNIIKSGNLDIELYHTDDKADRVKVDSDTVLFDDVSLWEPGAVVYETFEVVNEGDLALKYQLSVNVANATANANGNTLSDILKVGVIEGGTTITDRTALIGCVAEWKALSSFVEAGNLVEKNENDIYTIVIYWEPSEYDNDYNMNNGEGAPLTLDIGVTLFATQLTAEMDSFGDDYDEFSAVTTVAEAEAIMAQNKDVTLAGCNEPDGVLNIPADYTGTLTLANTTIKSVQAEKNANIVILGNVTVDANGSGIAMMSLNEEAFDGSAITANGELNISGSGALTAIAADVTGAFGIGGMNVTKLTVKDVHIVDVKGSFVQPLFVSDTKYGKSEPEGGAAIGSGFNGAEINLINVTIDNAQGGSKAAGIGARYWTGVTINIIDSIIKNVEGGNASAGIGSSRVSGDATESGTTISITNSIITAKGGQAGAGIGSGYDTHCGSNQPMCTINIADSAINAEGGKYAAGVGTGYHNAALNGEIKNSTVNAKPGEEFYKDSYTLAMDVGFGVIDPAREGQQIDSKLIYNGVEIRLPSCVVVANGTELSAALAEGKSVILTDNVVLDEALTITKSAVIQLNGKTLTSNGLDFQAGATIKNGVITSGGNTNMTPHIKVSGGTLNMYDVTVDVNHHLNANVYWAEATGIEVCNASAMFNDCHIKIDNPTGAQWVYSYGIGLNNATVTMNGGSITADCAEGTAAEGPTNPNAISSMGECTITLNSVNVDATYYATTVNGHLTINTTDKNITSSDVVDNSGGSHTLNYID